MKVQEVNAIWSNYMAAIEKDDCDRPALVQSSTAYRHRIRDRIFLGLHNISRDLLG